MATGPLLEEVFKVSGVPTHTFVSPSHSNRLKVALRTRGRGVIIEGPSGIGKSTAVVTSLRDLEMDQHVTQLSARSLSDLEMIRELPNMDNFGVVVIDDFHRLPVEDQNRIADLLKILADRETEQSKLVIIGINQAGANLISFAPDLANRIDRIRFESEPDQKIREMISKGEVALNIRIKSADNIVNGAQGSFYLAQLLCHEICTQQGVLESQPEPTEVETLYSSARRQVMERQRARFGPALKSFARGTRFRTGGRANYYHILRWLADAPDWSIDLNEEVKMHPNEKYSVKQVVEKGHLQRLCETYEVSSILHYNPDTRSLSVEDPHIMYYLKNLDWAEFIREVGFTNVNSKLPYDIALSFAGEDREYAEYLQNHLEEYELAVFYDKTEESRILADDVEAILGPIYETESRFVVAILGEKYGVKRWTLFETGKYRSRIEKNEVIPIWSVKIPQNALDPLQTKGGRTFDPDGNLAEQAAETAEVIAKKLGDS
ncbi:TIR domain-containing protein [Rhodococcus hoagii]|nr:TIR domain-containing protein [Prescottella equi]